MLRSRLLAARAARPDAGVAAAGVSLAAHGAETWGHVQRLAAYAGVDGEPPTRALLDRLLSAGVAVVLPVVTETELRWAPYDGWDALVAGPMGLLQPAGHANGSDALASVDLVLVPALAVDGHGNRLGRGKGYYDRALADVEPQRCVAVVYDDEVVDEIPVEDHDRPVGAVLTPSGVRALGG